jgi:hypothetical protein
LELKIVGRSLFAFGVQSGIVKLKFIHPYLLNHSKQAITKKIMRGWRSNAFF